MTAILGGGTVVLLFALALVAREIGPLAAWLAPRVTARATSRLPGHLRAIREEEWLADLEDMKDLQVFRLLRAFGFWIGAIRIARSPLAGLNNLTGEIGVVHDDDDIDAILDSIDVVLEENAEEFVRSFLIKGGE